MKVLGGILMGIGILIAGLSGLCSLVLFVTEASNTYGNLGSVIDMILGFGGIPFAIGLGLFFLGRHLVSSTGQG